MIKIDIPGFKSFSAAHLVLDFNGNGRNDLLMLKEAALSIGLIQAEGACSLIINISNVVCTSIVDALDLLLHPKRLLATLRN